MTEPDEALLYAREHWATICDEDGFPEVAEAYRRGVNDEVLATDALFYRAGARMAREQERERARWLVGYAVALETFRPGDSTSSIACEASAALAKYRGEA